jgi:hypothetical protein
MNPYVETKIGIDLHRLRLEFHRRNFSQILKIKKQLDSIQKIKFRSDQGLCGFGGKNRRCFR